MITSLFYHFLCFAVLLIQSVCCMSMLNKHSYFMDSSDLNNDDIVQLISSKSYLPNDKHLPKTSLLKSADNEVTYLLSKLTDEELIKLLNEQPKKNEYDLNDVVRLAFDSKFISDNKFNVEAKPREALSSNFGSPNSVKKRFKTVSQKSNPQMAFFRLENKQVDPFSARADADPNYAAIQKLSNILYSRPTEAENAEKIAEDEEKKELLFDVLVSQLKTLCCKKTRLSSKSKHYQPLNDFLPTNSEFSTNALDNTAAKNEHMFLIINDEIKSNGSEELISVDPDSLEKNSSVLLLGPITTPLTNNQLKLVMYRISNELSKAEYIPLLQELSDGNLSGNNIKLMKSLITGPETRRYIKPHRCNHQSKLARIYGGPKWLICTGYLNLNTPSLYD